MTENSHPTPPATLLTLPQVAAGLGISVRELRRLRASGSFGPEVITLTRRLQRVRAQEFSDWVARGCPPATRWVYELRGDYPCRSR